MIQTIRFILCLLLSFLLFPRPLWGREQAGIHPKSVVAEVELTRHLELGGTEILKSVCQTGVSNLDRCTLSKWKNSTEVNAISIDRDEFQRTLSSFFHSLQKSQPKSTGQGKYLASVRGGSLQWKIRWNGKEHQGNSLNMMDSAGVLIEVLSLEGALVSEFYR